jgi:hypothetical protein
MAPKLWDPTVFIADELTMVSEGMSALKTEIIPPMKESVASLIASDVENTSRAVQAVRAVKLLLLWVQGSGYQQVC